MKGRLLVPVIIALLAAAATFCTMRLTVKKCTCVGSNNADNISFLARELELNASQTAAIKDLHTALEVKLNSSCARHCSARAGLREFLSSETNDTERVNAVIAEMCRAYEESERATLDNIRIVRKVLDPEQKKQFDKLISECVCNSCNGCGNTETEHCK